MITEHSLIEMLSRNEVGGGRNKRLNPVWDYLHNDIAPLNTYDYPSTVVFLRAWEGLWFLLPSFVAPLQTHNSREKSDEALSGDVSTAN